MSSIVLRSCRLDRSDRTPGVGERWDTQGPRRCVPGANVGIRHANTVFSFCVEVSATLESWPLSRSARRASMYRSGDMIEAVNAPKRLNSVSWREEDTSDAPVTLTPRKKEKGPRTDPRSPCQEDALYPAERDRRDRGAG